MPAIPLRRFSAPLHIPSTSKNKTNTPKNDVAQFSASSEVIKYLQAQFTSNATFVQRIIEELVRRNEEMLETAKWMREVQQQTLSKREETPASSATDDDLECFRNSSPYGSGVYGSPVINASSKSQSRLKRSRARVKEELLEEGLPFSSPELRPAVRMRTSLSDGGVEVTELLSDDSDEDDKYIQR